MELTITERVVFIRQRILRIQQVRTGNTASEMAAIPVLVVQKADFAAAILANEELLFNYSHLLIDF